MQNSLLVVPDPDFPIIPRGSRFSTMNPTADQVRNHIFLEDRATDTGIAWAGRNHSSSFALELNMRTKRGGI